MKIIAVIDKHSGKKVFFETETNHLKKDLNYLEDLITLKNFSLQQSYYLTMTCAVHFFCVFFCAVLRHTEQLGIMGIMR